MKGKIVFLAVLLNDTGPSGNIEDAINETLRWATQNPKKSFIIDYAFSMGDSGYLHDRIPDPIEFDVKKDYEEGEFLIALKKNVTAKQAVQAHVAGKLKGYKFSVDKDPDFDKSYSVWADKDGSGCEIAGKIGEKSVATVIASTLQNLCK